jgi:ketosteroid isomerase-like protein
MPTTTTTLVERAIRSMSELRSDPGLFAADAVSWHNFDEVDVQTEPESYDAVRAIRTVVPDFDFHEIRTHDTGGGVSVAQYVILGTLPDGATLRVPGVLIAHSCGGRITRLEEYVDTAQLAPVFALLGQT